MSAIQPSTEHAEALDTLDRAIVNAAKSGHATPCSDDKRFTSNMQYELEQAAVKCIFCPARRECSAAGEFETHGVWGGHVLYNRKPIYAPADGGMLNEVLGLLEAGESPYLICERVKRHPDSIAQAFYRIGKDTLARKFVAVTTALRAAA